MNRTLRMLGMMLVVALWLTACGAPNVAVTEPTQAVVPTSEQTQPTTAPTSVEAQSTATPTEETFATMEPEATVAASTSEPEATVEAASTPEPETTQATASTPAPESTLASTEVEATVEIVPTSDTVPTRQVGAAPEGQFIIGSLEEPGNLSPLIDLPHHFPEHVPQTLMFDSLIQFMPDSTVKPKLASEWNISDDGKVYTFTIDRRAKWWDGSPVTATDVKFTFDAMMDENTGSSSEGVEAIERVDELDPQTVRFTLKSLNPLFLSQGGSRGIVPSKLLKDQDLTTADFNRAPMGSGPYKFVSWEQGSALTLEANTDYFLGVPRIANIIFKVLPNQNVILTQLRSGEINYALISPRDLTPVESIAGTTVYENPTPRFFDISPNYALPFFAEQKVREGILTAIDRQGIVDNVLLGHGTVVDANVSPASWAYNPDTVKHPYDPERAKQLFAEAGYAAGADGILAKDGTPLQFEVMVNAFDSTLQQVLTIAQQQLKEVGVAMTIAPVEPGVFSARRSAKEYQALARVWNPVYDPDQNGLNKTGNFYGYSNPEVDRIGQAALETDDQDARKQLYMEQQVILSTDVARLWLYSENELHATNLKLQGPENHPVNFFWNLWQWQTLP